MNTPKVYTEKNTVSFRHANKFQKKSVKPHKTKRNLEKIIRTETFSFALFYCAAKKFAQQRDKVKSRKGQLVLGPVRLVHNKKTSGQNSGSNSTRFNRVYLHVFLQPT